MEYSENTMNLAMTFQMSLDCFGKENKKVANYDEAMLEALQCLESITKFRSYDKKQKIAKEALSICPECIEAYYAYGMYSKNCFMKMEILKKGMEKATLLLGKDFFMQSIEDFYECENARSYFQIKFAYALTLYENGYMRKALQQLKEIINLNPKDHFNAHHLLYALHLYFEDSIAIKELMNAYPKRDTMYVYVLFLNELKMANYDNAKAIIPLLKESNIHLFEIVSKKRMNTLSSNGNTEGSEGEAAYIYQLLHRQLLLNEGIALFLLENENR